MANWPMRSPDFQNRMHIGTMNPRKYHGAATLRRGNNISLSWEKGWGEGGIPLAFGTCGTAKLALKPAPLRESRETRVSTAAC